MPAGLASTALVLSIAAPFGGNLWYGLTSISPFAGVYYLQKGNRQEEVRCPEALHGEIKASSCSCARQHYDLGPLVSDETR